MLDIKPKHIFIEDLCGDFVRNYVFPTFRKNAHYEGCYLQATQTTPDRIEIR